MLLNKIVLIDPVECHQEEHYQRINISTNYSGTSIGIRDPLGIEYISGYLKSKGFDTSIIVKNNLRDEELLDLIMEQKPYIVAFSVWSYMFERVSKMAAQIKKAMPDVYIVLGGYHPSFSPDVVKHPAIDFVIMGEGEITFHELASVLRTPHNEDELRLIRGIAFLNSQHQVITTPPRERVEFSALPFPDRPEHIVKLSKITGLTYPSVDRQVSPLQISFSRGCPNRCRFCPSAALWQNEVKYREPEDVINEIKYLQETFGTNYIYFSDLTFNIHPQKVTELCERIIGEGIDISWSAMVKIDDRFENNKAVFELMKRSGCSRLAFGVETFDENNQVKSWHSKDLIRKNLEYVDNLGIITRAFLLMGFPFENKEYYENLITNLKLLPIDNIRLAFVTPFPGTRLYEEYYDVLIMDFTLYTGEYPVLPVADIPQAELIAIRKQIVREFYNSHEYISRICDKIKKHPHLQDSFDYFLQNNLYPEGIVDAATINRFKQGLKS